MKRIRVLIVDDIGDTRESIRRLLEFEADIEVIGEAGSGSEGLRLAENLHPDIVLMDINMPDMDGIRATELLALRVPDTAVIIMSVQGEQAYLRRAMMAGAREYIVKPFTGDELASTVVKVFEIENRKREALGEKTEIPLVTEKGRMGQIISFFSTKGGVGKTTLATNLAVELARSGKYRVLLIDLNLQFGDVCVFLNLSPKRSIADLAQSGSLQYSEIQSYLLTHSSGIQVLVAPTRPEYADLVSVEQVEQILQEVKPHFDFIICDTVSRFEEISLLSLDLAEKIFLIVGMDVPALKNTKLSLETMDGLHYLDKVTAILNRSANDLGLELKDVEKSLDFKISFEIPSDGKALLPALNQGVPFVKQHPQSKASDGIRKMALSLINQSNQVEEVSSSSQECKYKGLNRLRKVFGF
ncbi:AAA family ATPase [Desulfitobacterium sp. AusDCA]|uniref:AAA family ATPase n=1 Tax=Desulfitobacterium sp. AusDCA TaxID=3240383 RepID=UPI003DA76BBF